MSKDEIDHDQHDEGDRKDRRGWQVEKKISVGDLITLAVALTSVLVAYGKLDTRIAIVETVQVIATKETVRVTEDLKASRTEVTETLKDIGRRLDTLSDRIRK